MNPTTTPSATEEERISISKSAFNRHQEIAEAATQLRNAITVRMHSTNPTEQELWAVFKAHQRLERAL
jgi:hypothetical protein